MQEVQQKDHFIGRTAEIKAFQSWLDDPDAPRILYIHDTAEEIDKKGGVGKTWLLRKCAEITSQSRRDIAIVMVDFFNISDRDRIFLVQKIITGLTQLYPHWNATTFNQTVQLYQSQTASGGGESLVIQFREELSVALADDLRRLDDHLGETQKTLLVFFDTFEAIEQNPSVAVLRPSLPFPDDYQFTHMRAVIAGRNRLNWDHPNWRGREQEVQVMALDPFNRQEMQEYIAAESVYDIPSGSEQERAFYERTEGRPIIIGLAIDVLNHRILNLRDLITVSKTEFESYLVPQVNKLENPLNWVILFMAHVYHRFNMPVLECILAGVDLHKPVRSISQEELAQTLPNLSFVRQSVSGSDFVLHDEMRRLVTRYCWEELDPYHHYRKDISHSIINYYEQKIVVEQNEQLRQSYMIEILHHRLFVDLDDAMRYFESHFQSALRFLKTGFARLLLQEVQSFAHLLSSTQQNDVRLAEVWLFRAEDDPAPALAILDRLRRETDAQWQTEHQIELLLEEGRCYVRQSRLVEAADRFAQCLHLVQGDERQSASYLISLGFIARRRGEFATALNYYEQSLAIFKKLHEEERDDYATTLMNTATVYRRQGKIGEALRRSKIAWRIRLGLFQAGKISENQVASILHNLGQIHLDAGNVVEAEKHFKEAFDIYLRTNYKSGIAMTYNRFGAVQLAKGELEDARSWFVKAQDISQNLNAEQYINSLNKQGRICLELQQWDEAMTFFERAISIAHPIPDYFQETESRIDLADALFRLGQDEQAEHQLQHGEEIASRENYGGLLAQIEKQRAEKWYRVRDYTQAFQHFALYCQRSLEYNYASYTIAVQKVVDALLGVPKQEVPALVEEVRAYWMAQQIGKNYPELIQACEEVGNFMI